METNNINNTLKIKKIHEEAIIPSKRNEDSGYDLYASPAFPGALIKPGDTAIIPCGIAIEVPLGYTFLLFERGSTGYKSMSRRCGVIDSGYRGEVAAIINNTGTLPIFIDSEYECDKFRDSGRKMIFYPTSKAIVQGIIIQHQNWEVEVVDELSISDRGTRMLGSTNK